MRVLVIKEDTDLKGLSGQLINERAAAGQSDLALNALRAANPHVDLSRLRAGTVLLIPDAPGLKQGAGDTVQADAFQDFQQLVRDGLASATEKARSANAARARERGETLAAINMDTVKRVMEADPELRQQIADAVKSFKDEQQQADQDEKTLAQSGKAALTQLDGLGKLLG